MQSLIKRRLFRSSWFILGYPSRLALLLDDSRRDATLLSLRQQWETYEEMKILQSKFWIAKSSRSPFLTPNVRQLVEPLRSDGWKVTEPVLEKIRLREGGFKQSRVVENGLLKERQAERTANNSEMAEQLWQEVTS